MLDNALPCQRGVFFFFCRSTVLDQEEVDVDGRAGNVSSSQLEKEHWWSIPASPILNFLSFAPSGKDILVHSPPFPLIIKHVDVDQIRKVTTKDEELLSLQHQGHSPLRVVSLVSPKLSLSRTSCYLRSTAEGLRFSSVSFDFNVHWAGSRFDGVSSRGRWVLCFNYGGPLQTPRLANPFRDPLSMPHASECHFRIRALLAISVPCHLVYLTAPPAISPTYLPRRLCKLVYAPGSFGRYFLRRRYNHTSLAH